MTWVYLVLFTGSGVWLSVIDLRTHTLPNRVVYPAVFASVLLAAVHSLAASDPSPLLHTLVGATLMFGLFYIIAWLSRGALGGGDVKFAVFLGGMISVLSSPWWVLVATAGSFLLGGVVSLCAILIWRKPANTKIAFGPVMFVASASVLFWAIG